MKHITTPMILGTLTVLEMCILHSMAGSVILWVGYGIYRLINDD
jgi:hypothetical protein